MLSILSLLINRWTKNPRRWDLIMQPGTGRKTRGIGVGDNLGGIFFIFEESKILTLNLQMTLWKSETRGDVMKAAFLFLRKKIGMGYRTI
jgi:hypothetical protein